MASTEILQPKKVSGKDESWRRIDFEHPIFDQRARHYLEERIQLIKEVAEAYADRYGMHIKLKYAIHWDQLPRITRSITKHIREVVANGR